MGLYASRTEQEHDYGDILSFRAVCPIYEKRDAFHSIAADPYRPPPPAHRSASHRLRNE